MLTNSWVIVDEKTGKPIAETWRLEVAERAAATMESWRIMTAHEWLVRLNREVKEGKHSA